MLFSRFLLIMLFAVGLTACDENKSEIEALIIPNLKDPESFRVDSLTFNQSKTVACLFWNAKNAMGGYGNPTMTSFVNGNGKWRIKAREEKTNLCTPNFLEVRDEYRALTGELQDMYSNIGSFAISGAQKEEFKRLVRPMLGQVMRDPILENVSVRVIQGLNQGLDSFLQPWRGLRGSD